MYLKSERIRLPCQQQKRKRMRCWMCSSTRWKGEESSHRLFIHLKAFYNFIFYFLLTSYSFSGWSSLIKKEKPLALLTIHCLWHLIYLSWCLCRRKLVLGSIFWDVESRSYWVVQVLFKPKGEHRSSKGYMESPSASCFCLNRTLFFVLLVFL